MAQAGRPAAVAMTSPGGLAVSEAIVDAGALLGMESGESGPPAEFDVEFVDYPFTKPGETWTTHKAIARRTGPRLAVAPDVEDRTDLEHAIDLADQLAQHAETVIMVPKAVHPTEIPDRFRVGLPFQPSFGSGGIALPDGGQPQTTLLDFGQNRIDDFRDVGPVHVLGGPPHDQLRIPSFGVDVASLDTAVALTYARFGRVWFRAGQVEFPGRGIYERLEASLRNIRRAWGHDVAPTIELTETMADLLEADTQEEREAILGYARTGARGAPPPFPPDLAQEPFIERFFSKNKYSIPPP